MGGELTRLRVDDQNHHGKNELRSKNVLVCKCLVTPYLAMSKNRLKHM